MLELIPQLVMAKKENTLNPINNNLLFIYLE
jgi:hypothetical protein